MPGMIPDSVAVPPRRTQFDLRATGVDALIVLGWFAMAGVLGALVWWQVTELPKVTKSGDSASLAPEELVKQVAVDGWFFVIAAVGGLLSGVVLLLWRRRDALSMIVLVAVGGGLAAWLMIHVGLALGPGPELAALRELPEGGQAAVRLKLNAPGMAWVWPISAVLGALMDLWILLKPDDRGP